MADKIGWLKRSFTWALEVALKIENAHHFLAVFTISSFGFLWWNMGSERPIELICFTALIAVNSVCVTILGVHAKKDRENP